MFRATLDTASFSPVSCTRLSRSLDGISIPVPLPVILPYAVRTPRCTHHGLGSSAFARRYLRNRSYFLFLRLLRCFSSAGSPLSIDRYCRSGFPHSDIHGYIDYLRLPVAFRSLSRPSSAPDAKAFSLCSFSLELLSNDLRSFGRAHV